MRRGGAKSFVDDLVLGRGVVLSRAATSLRSIETQPWTRRFVRSLDGRIFLVVGSELSLSLSASCVVCGSHSTVGSVTVRGEREGMAQAVRKRTLGNALAGGLDGGCFWCTYMPIAIQRLREGSQEKL